MSQARPITRSSRRTDIAANEGQTVFSFPHWLWDAQDLQVQIKRAGESVFTTQTTGFTVTVANDLASASVTFTTAPRQSGDGAVTVRMQGKRVHERTTDVTRAGTISAAQLEREFDRIATVLQETKRDSEEGVTEANAAAVSAQTSAATATAQATTATTQANAASASAATALTQAGIATTQAGIATTKAGEADASADAAAVSETNAETYRDAALLYKTQAETAAAGVNGAAQLDGTITKLSGWMFPIRDAANRLAGGITRSAQAVFYRLFADTLTGTADDLSVGVQRFRGLGTRHGRWYFSVSDAALRLAMGVRQDGAFFAAKILPYQDADLFNIVCAGDSMTASAGATAGNTYPEQLATLLGRTVTNAGIGGQHSIQIAGRAGAPFALTLSGNVINSGSNSVTHFDGVAVASMNANAAAPQPLSTAADNTSRSMSIILNGVRGTLARTASGGPPSTTETYTFTPDGNQALPVKCPPGSIAVADRGTDDSKITIIWVGRNGFTAVGAQAQILADIAAIVNRLQGRRFAVLSICNADGETAGSSNYNTIMAINAAVQRTWPDNYIDVRRALVAAYDSGIPQDVTDYGNDVPPSSLRSDAAHLNNAGYGIVAASVAQFIRRKGW